MKVELFLKKIQKGKLQLILGIFFGIITLGILIISGNDGYKTLKNPTPLLEAKEGDYAYIDVQIMTEHFAVSDSKKIEHKSYILWDENKYLFIAAIDENVRKDLEPIYQYSYSEEENVEVPPVVRIKGTATQIPNDLQKLARESYNELAGESLVTSNNFKEYFGNYYLDTFKVPSLFSYLIWALPTLILTVLFFLGFVNVRKNTKKYKLKYAEKWEKILEEIEEEKTIHYEKAKFLITKNYVISYASGLEIFPHQEIVWIYPYEYRYNGMVTQKSIFVITKDSKSHKIGNMGANKKNLVLFDEMYETLLNQMPHVLSGFTKENQEKAKELYLK